MASWVFCNYCFQSPSRKSSFSLTSCGHVYCDSCLGKGKKDECLICKVPCRTVLLSKHTDSDIQAFFMGIDGLCRKYSQETSQDLKIPLGTLLFLQPVLPHGLQSPVDSHQTVCGSVKVQDLLWMDGTRAAVYGHQSAARTFQLHLAPSSGLELGELYLACHEQI